MKKILIIDDDLDICLLLNRYLTKKGYEVEEAYKAEAGIAKAKAKDFDVVLCDFRLPDMSGLDVIQNIKKLKPQTQVIIITGYSDIKMAVKTVKVGAYEYVTKPIHPEEILMTIEQAINLSGEESGTAPKSATPPAKSRSNGNATGAESMNYVKGRSAKSKLIHQSIELIAPTNMSVIILGETGTGKEVVARTIHNLSQRANMPFVAVDCGALPKELAASELFGHVKGAFTGAIRDKEGQFEVAKGGTLFLDEIGNLSYENQIKLLRVLQERKIKRVGGTRDIDIDVRIVVATNEDLKEAVSRGDFRQDLYYRLNEFKIELPPLRERQSDLIEFAEFFLQSANQQLNKEVKAFDPEVETKLKGYYWHGNLRELKNVVKRATLLSTSDVIKINALPEEIIHPAFIQMESEDEDELTDLKTVAEKAERRAILQVLQKTGYNKTKTARILKVDRKTLYNKMNMYKIDFEG